MTRLVTKGFLEGQTEENWQYYTPGSALEEKEPPSHLFTPPQGAISLCVKLSDPLDPTKDCDYYGVIEGRNEIVPLESMSILGWHILHLAQYCAFSCEFTISLRPQIPRFVRWFFHAPTSTLNPVKGVRKLMRQALNNLYYIYQVSGPYDVKKGLRTFLNSTLVEGAHKVKGSYGPEIKSASRLASSELIDALFTNGADLPGTWTSADDWRIHIDPRGVGGRITDIVPGGHIFVAGALPNMVFTGSSYSPYYEWKTGHRMVPVSKLSNVELKEKKPDEEYWFRINFQAKRPIYIVLLLPWLALGIGLLNLIRGCLYASRPIP